MIYYKPQTLVAYEVHFGTYEVMPIQPRYYDVMMPYWVPDTGTTAQGFYDDEAEYIEEDQ